MVCGMVLGEKLFDESGNVSGFKVTKVHPSEGVTTEVSFISHIQGEGKFPSGENRVASAPIYEIYCYVFTCRISLTKFIKQPIDTAFSRRAYCFNCRKS